MTISFGIECEVAGGTSAMLDALGLDGLHGYHCDCERCEPERSSPDWTAQEDCTADGEFISRILTYGDDGDRAIGQLAAALKSARAVHSNGQGLHVHVDTSDMTPTTWVYFWRLWFRYQDEVGMLASGSYNDVRSYNQEVRFSQVVGTHEPGVTPDFWTADPVLVAPRIGQPYDRATWVNPRTGHGTAEFRLWNATRVEWRIHLAAGVSTALIRAALDGVTVTKHDERTLFDIVSPYLSDKSTAAYIRATIHQERAA